MKQEKPDFKGCLFDREEMKRNGHAVLAGYDNHTVTYDNGDGTKTIYVSSAPIEKQGLRLQKGNGCYSSQSDYVSVMLPEILSKDCGIRIGESIEIFPALDTAHASVLTERKNVFGQEKECVAYRDFYGEASLYCYATSFGVNFEIEISEYTGNNLYSIKLKQPKGMFTEEEPDYIAFRNEEDLQSMLFTPLAVDANGKWNYNNRIILSFEDEETCYVHFIVDEGFLNDPNTQYPVTLNQSVYEYRHKQPDTSVYSAAKEYARHYLSPFMLLGSNTPKGEGMALLRFEVLDDLAVCGEDILKAEYCFTNLLGLQRKAIVEAYAITNDWCSVNTRWKSRPGYDKMPVKTTMVCDPGVYGIDITRLIREMMKNRREYEPLYSVRNSFLIKSNTKNSSLLLASGDAGFCPPYLKILVKNSERKESNYERRSK